MHSASDMLKVDGSPPSAIRGVTDHYGVNLEVVPNGHVIPGSFWGEPEAGVIGKTVYVRGDTPLHSCLHELCHIICMSPARRAALERDAGGDDAEECAVCYLQLILADEIAGASRQRLMHDMDAWGYSFRLGSTARWFAEDAADARQWLCERSLLNAAGRTTWRLRGNK